MSEEKIINNNNAIVWVISIAAFALCGFVVFESLDAVSKLPPTEFEIRRLYFASSILTVLASIWLIGLVACVWGPQPADGKGEAPGKQAFDTLTKTITPLITMVLVFYFTLSPPSPPKPSEETQQAFQANEIKIDNETPNKGDTILISSSVLGGKAPYSYTLSFSPKDDVGLPTRGKKSEDGNINESVKIPPTYEPNKEITVTLEVKDSSDKKPIKKVKTIKVKG